MKCKKCKRGQICDKCNHQLYIKKLMNKWLKQNQRNEKKPWMKRCCKSYRSKTGLNNLKNRMLSGSGMGVNFDNF